jgi:hypothetical protein
MNNNLWKVSTMKKRNYIYENKDEKDSLHNFNLESSVSLKIETIEERFEINPNQLEEKQSDTNSHDHGPGVGAD